MHFTAFITALVSVTVFLVLSHRRALRRNAAYARQSNLRVIYTPIFFQHPLWLASQGLIAPLLAWLPSKWTEPWLSLLVMKDLWHHGYAPFQKVGSDTFLAVASTGNVLWTCDPQVVNQLCTRRQDFPKSLDVIEVLNIFGPTVTASEGNESILYRKVAAPAFNESTHRRVWNFSLKACGELLEKWAEQSDQGSVSSLQVDVKELTLKILSYCSYGQAMSWSSDSPNQSELQNGHRVTYQKAIASLLEEAMVIFLTPRVILERSPLPIHRRAHQAFEEAKQYMAEMSKNKEKEIRDAGISKDPNLLEVLVHSLQQDESQRLSPEAVLGNIFIFILAGHETSANTLSFALTILACFPYFQAELQQDLDRILGEKPIDQWTYETDFPRLLDAYPGAFLNEILRLYPVVPFFPKMTESHPQTIAIGNELFTIPPKTLVLINTTATHNNPKHWSSGAQAAGEQTTQTDLPWPLSSFSPQRWLKTPESRKPTREAFTDESVPVSGSFIPFSVGPRACMGQRFAKTEFVASLARIVKFYHVELYVDGADDKALGKARQNAIRQLSGGVTFSFALKMSKEVPLQFVKRG